MGSHVITLLMRWTIWATVMIIALMCSGLSVNATIRSGHQLRPMRRGGGSLRARAGISVARGLG